MEHLPLGFIKSEDCFHRMPVGFFRALSIEQQERSGNIQTFQTLKLDARTVHLKGLPPLRRILRRIVSMPLKHPHRENASSLSPLPRRREENLPEAFFEDRTPCGKFRVEFAQIRAAYRTLQKLAKLFQSLDKHPLLTARIRNEPKAGKPVEAISHAAKVWAGAAQAVFNSSCSMCSKASGDFDSPG